MDTFITYDRLSSKDSVHQMASMQPSVLYAQLKNFIIKFTDAKQIDSAHIVFTSKKVLNSLKYLTVFGIPQYDFSNSLGTSTRAIYFAVGESNLEKALEISDKNPDVIVSIKWIFKFIHPTSKKLIDNQENIPIIDERVENSQIYVRLSRKRSTFSPWFAFPFPEINEANQQYIDEIKRHLPFKMSDKSWRKWRLSKNGNWTPRSLSGG